MSKKKLGLSVFILLISVGFSCRVLAVPAPVSTPSDPGKICETRSIMALAWTICLYDDDKTPGQLRSAIETGMQEVHRIDEWMSEWKPESLISQINAQAGIKPVKVSDEALQAIQLSLKEGELSEGAFDITFNAFFGLYDWHPGHEKFPSDEDIKRLLPLVDYRKVKVDTVKKTVFLPEKGMKIGLGGMGEGWAVDSVYELMRKAGIRSGYVDASGAVRVWGKKPNGKLWLIAVGDPRPMQPDPARKSAIYKMYLTDVAVTTAGDTEKSFRKNGRLYHHIIDPKTGYSADRSVQVTCIGKTATLCDLVDDGIFIKGGDKGKNFAESRNVEAVIVDPDKKITLTKGIRSFQSPWGPALELKTVD